MINKFIKRGFTLLEIMIAMLILMFASTGIFATFVSSKKYAKLAYHRVQAINFARQTFEDLRKEVNATTWDKSGNKLLNGFSSPLVQITGSDNIVFNRSYNVSFVDLDGDGFDSNEPRSVTINITWQER